MLFPYLNQDILKDIQTSVTKTLQTTYQLQQKTLTQKLAGLYDVSPKLAKVLATWGGELALKGIVTESIKQVKKEAREELASEVVNSEVVKQLQELQSYAALLKSVALSSAEAQALVKYPDCFGVAYEGSPHNLP